MALPEPKTARFSVVSGLQRSQQCKGKEAETTPWTTREQDVLGEKKHLQAGSLKARLLLQFLGPQPHYWVHPTLAL